MKTILLISPYWKEPHRWMVSSVKLANLWERLGYRVVVACMGTETRTQQITPGITVHFRKDVFFKDPWNYGIAWGFSGFVMRLVCEEKPDVIVINKILFWSSLAGIRLRLAGRKFFLLTDAFVGQTWWPRGLLPRIGAFLYAWTVGWLLLCLAEKVVTFHPQPPSLLRRLLIAGKTRVIPTGLDPSFHVPRVHHREAKVVVTYVGRLESVKGVEDFLHAVVGLKDFHPELVIQVVGWHGPRHPLVSAFSGRVTFTGLREDIPAILSQTDIFVLPSFSEGLSNALQEAMASGCACIASDVGGNSFLIQNGKSGLLFPAGDRSALAAHVRRLIEDPAKRKMLGEEARRRIEAEFDWKVVGERYRELFERSVVSGQ